MPFLLLPLHVILHVKVPSLMEWSYYDTTIVNVRIDAAFTPRE